MPRSMCRLPGYAAFAEFALYACALGGRLTVFDLPLVSNLA